MVQLMAARTWSGKPGPRGAGKCLGYAKTFCPARGRLNGLYIKKKPPQGAASFGCNPA